MKFTDINAIYSKKVSEFLSNGYTINSNTMGGSQGDIAAIDFRKGEEVIRVRLHKEMCHTINGEHLWGDCIALTVGRCKDERVIKAVSYDWNITLWNNELEVIEERVFWQMNYRRSDWYIDGEEGLEALRKRSDRCRNQVVRMERCEFPGTEKLMLPAIRRHIGNDRFPVSKVLKVYKYWSDTDKRYRYGAELNYRHNVVFC